MIGPDEKPQDLVPRKKIDTRYDIKTVLEEFYDSMKEPVQIINIRQERI